MIKNYLKLLVALVFATNVMAQNIPSYVPKDGLVGWWPFNGNANDESGNGNNGTVNGATLTTDRNGNVNNAYEFYGENSIIKADKIKIPTTKNISISFWLNTDNIIEDIEFIKLGNYERSSTWGIIVGKGVFGKNENSIILNYGRGCQGTGGQALVHPIKISNWQNLTFVSKGLNDSTTIYLNGLFIGKTKNMTSIGSCDYQNLLFGFIKAKLDDIAILNRALTDQEVKQLYEGCTKETATSSSFKSYVFTNNSSINLSANPAKGTFSGEAVTNNAFYPSKAKLGKNHVKYTFKNSTGCADSTNFEMIMVDTLGNKCSTYDTLKIKVQLTTGMKAGQIATMNVYPNPTSDIIIIEASDVAALNGYSYKMVDLQGKQVYKELVTKAKTEISLKSIGTKGVYILHILDEKGVSIENKKIVLE
jgi:hypothetical protein